MTVTFLKIQLKKNLKPEMIVAIKKKKLYSYDVTFYDTRWDSRIITDTSLYAAIITENVLKLSHYSLGEKDTV